MIPKQDTENIQNSLCPVSYKFTARLLHIKELLIQFSLIGSVGLDYIFTSLFPWSLILNLNNGYAVSVLSSNLTFFLHVLGALHGC